MMFLSAYAHKLLNYGAAHAAFPSPRALSPCFELSHVTVRTSTTTRVQAQEWTRAIARWKAGPCLCPGVLPDCVPTNGNSWRARYTSPPLPPRLGVTRRSLSGLDAHSGGGGGAMAQWCHESISRKTVGEDGLSDPPDAHRKHSASACDGASPRLHSGRAALEAAAPAGSHEL